MKLARILTAIAACAAISAHAKCITNDSWRGFDKGEHAIAGAAIAAGWTFQTRDPWKGFAAGVIVAALKEATDAAGGGTCSVQDFAVTVAGAALGAAGSGWALKLTDRKTPILAYNTTF